MTSESRPWWRRRAAAPRGAVTAEAAARTTTWVRPAALHDAAHPVVTTRVGTLDGPGVATVDDRGLVTPAGASWSLDWWVGGDDRWHLPAREVAVRQQLLLHAPVVETAMRVPGGDAVQRVYAVQVPDGHVLVVEVENQSSIPFALAWSVRPFVADGVGRIDAVAIEGGSVRIDGAAGVVLDRPAGRAAVGSAAAGDVADVVFAGRAAPEPQHVECADGLAQGTAIVAVPHRATVRAVLPLAVTAALSPAFPPVLPAAADVAAGWGAHVDNGVRLELPEGPVADAVARARRRLLLAATDGGSSGVSLLDRGQPLTTVAVADALGMLGHDQQAGRLLAGWFVREPVGVGALGPALVALHRHWRRTDDVELVRAAREQVRDAVALVADRMGRAGEPGPALAAWAVAALEAGAALLGIIGDRRAATDAADAAVRSAARRDDLLRDAPLGPGAGADDDLARAVLRAAALGVLDVRHPAVDRVVAHLAPSTAPAVVIDLASVEIARGEPAGHDRLATWLATPEPDEPEVAAGVLLAARRLLAVERDGTIVLVPAVPDAWLGQALEAHGLVVGATRLSFAVRWHGSRPALLWETTGAAVSLGSGLDPAWHADSTAGEALLAEPVRAG